MPNRRTIRLKDYGLFAGGIIFCHNMCQDKACHFGEIRIHYKQSCKMERR